jgi:DNA-binding MarR family transcriptional regulator
MLDRDMSESPQPRNQDNRESDARTLTALAGLSGMLGFHLRMAYVAISRHFAGAMQSLDLTQKQLGVLWLIGANGGVSQVALAGALSMDRASMMAIVDRLQARDLLYRERSKKDGRRQELYLTPKGRKMLAQSKTAMAEHEAWITQRFTASEISALTQALDSIHE